MNRALVDTIARAVLYEGYILYPYRPSVKNRQRWTFGGLAPRAVGQAQGDAWTMQTECLVQGDARTTLTSARFNRLLTTYDFHQRVVEFERAAALHPQD